MGTSSTVILLSCADYEPARVAEVTARGLEQIGARRIAAACAAPDRPALLKPNLLRPSAVEKGVSTNPAVFTAVARWLKEAGAALTWGDSPNGIFTQGAAARRCGLLDAAEALGLPMAAFDDAVSVPWEHGTANRRFTVARAATTAGGLVNLPKLKSHSLTRITAAMKNLFGLVPGALKAQYHVTHPDVASFSRMIADLNGLLASLVPQRLVVMDAVDAMEGNGPAGGDLVRLGFLLFADDPVAADAVACRVIGLDPLSIPMIRFADEAGIGNARPESINLAGDAFERFRPAAFKVPPRSPVDAVPRFLLRLAKDLMASKPVIDPARCISCGECVSSCPTTPKSLAMAPRTVPVYDYGTCIRCFCCQETCPQGAISVKAAPLGRVLGGGKRGIVENA